MATMEGELLSGRGLVVLNAFCRATDLPSADVEALAQEVAVQAGCLPAPRDRSDVERQTGPARTGSWE